MDPVSAFYLNYGEGDFIQKNQKTSLFVTSYHGHSPVLTDAQERRKEAIIFARKNEYSKGLEKIRELFSMVEVVNETTRCELASIIEDSVGSFCSLAFSKPFQDEKSRLRVDLGLEALELQLQSGSLPSPYNQVSRNLFLGALRALSTIISNDADRASYHKLDFVSTETIFRILQRLLSGVGIRNYTSGSKVLSERDFNAVLNALTNAGRMDIAHKVVSLQEKTPTAPKLSPVTYSILLKGYGRIGDTENVEALLARARHNNIVPDIIMLNSILDAYINCDQFDEAEIVFQRTTEQSGRLSPNLRTYNTMLKGCAQRGALQKAIKITKLMEERKLWDFVTTNTLVSVAVNAGDFEFAENILRKYTSVNKYDNGYSTNRRQHPNVEAYTALLNGYAKSGKLTKTVGTFKHMINIGVSPNEFTYTCLISAFVKKRKIKQATKMLDFMEESGIRPTSVTYNAFLTALQQVGQHNKVVRSTTLQRNIPYECDDEALAVVRMMMKKGVFPTVKTISILMQCFASCSQPRVQEAEVIIDSFERDGIIPRHNAEVNTSLMKVYGTSNDVKGALEVFRRIEKPDVVAVNTFLDVACRNNMPGIAFETFNHFFAELSSSKSALHPNVITFSILISSQLRLNSKVGLQKARRLYTGMRSRGIKPDIPLVDMVLSATVRGGRSSLKRQDIKFTLDLLKDAEILPWLPGELEHRKQTVRNILTGKMSDIWSNSEDKYGFNADKEDDLLEKKGWNKVDSGFRLWGQEGDSISASEGGVESDSFLASKGWNSLDSGFRII